MINFKRKYKDINDTLQHIRLQVYQSIPYAAQVVPEFLHPVDLFRWMKDRTQYKNDPHDTELLQTMKTLFEGNYWGIPGAGDCDCFTIATLAACQVQGWPCWVKIAGRDKIAPVHIWAGVNWNGQDIPLDMTEKQPGRERVYKYVQKINFKPV